jgi:hypothetical protein
MNRLIGVLLIVIVILINPGRVFADQSLSTGNLDLGVIGEKEFLDGSIYYSNFPIFWESDEPWAITIESSSNEFMVIGKGEYSLQKPISDLLWRLTDGTDWYPLSINSEVVDWDDETGEGVIYMDFLLKLNWLTDGPGTYDADLTFTIGPQ